MRAIIIEEERFVEVTDLMRLEALRLKDSSEPARLNIDKQTWDLAVDMVQRSMHFHFVRWAQSHGARCAR